ncbi:MAG: hypothetical protein QOI78_7811 [Actinomycetota bacterium]|nr:hypothetical protein [Actinomycetota bacterium]
MYRDQRQSRNWVSVRPSAEPDIMIALKIPYAFPRSRGSVK